MRTLILILPVLFLSLTCQEESRHDHWENGYIVGFDPRDCACCGGWLIKIGSETMDYQFFDLPDGSVVDLDPTRFPLRVRVKWAWSGTCSENRTILLLEIEEY
jgi:hypothetical protein